MYHDFYSIDILNIFHVGTYSFVLFNGSVFHRIVHWNFVTTSVKNTNLG